MRDFYCVDRICESSTLLQEPGEISSRTSGVFIKNELSQVLIIKKALRELKNMSGDDCKTKAHDRRA